MKASLIMLIAGLIMLALAVAIFWSGAFVTRFGQAEGRSSPFYWVVLCALVLLGSMNTFAGLRALLR